MRSWQYCSVPRVYQDTGLVLSRCSCLRPVHRSRRSRRCRRRERSYETCCVAAKATRATSTTSRLGLALQRRWDWQIAASLNEPTNIAYYHDRGVLVS